MPTPIKSGQEWIYKRFADVSSARTAKVLKLHYLHREKKPSHTIDKFYSVGRYLLFWNNVLLHCPPQLWVDHQTMANRDGKTVPIRPIPNIIGHWRRCVVTTHTALRTQQL